MPAPQIRRRARVAGVAAVVLSLVLLAACSSMGAKALFGDRVVFTAAQLQADLDKRFPRDYDELEGLVTLRVSDPELAIPPGGDRVRLAFDVALGSLGQAGAANGHIAVTSGLRWDPSTRGLHLDAPALESADIPQLGAMNATGRDLIDAWLRDYARREPVYRFDDSLVERLASRRIGSTTIEDGQVVVHLGR